jgi:uncharacterized protein (DUF488 family)
MTVPYFTIGHSNRSTAEFLALLGGAGIEVLVDVRTLPGSRSNPQFNDDVLAASLAGAGIRYERVAELGGLRRRSHDVAPELNGFWENRSFHNYADYAMGPEFASGLATLRELGQTRRCAIMCSEAVWWRCHRRIIADYLIASGAQVLHVMSAKRIEPAKLTAGACVHADGHVSYPAA